MRGVFGGEPVARALAGLVEAVLVLGDDAVQTELPRGGVHRDALAFLEVADVDGGVGPQCVVEAGLALVERVVQERLAVQVEDVEHLVVDGRPAPGFGPGEPALDDGVTLGDALVAERDQFAVEHDARVPGGVAERVGDFRERGGDVGPAPRVHAHVALADDGDGADALPLDLVETVGRVGRLGGGGGNHGLDQTEGECSAFGAGLRGRRHGVRRPSAPCPGSPLLRLLPRTSGRGLLRWTRAGPP